MRGNKVVLFLPIAVMIGLFVFGYFSFTEPDSITQEEMQDSTEFDHEVSGNRLEVYWQWNDYPDDGVVGDDYIELIAVDEDPANLQEEIENVQLELHHADEVIYESSDWVETEDGVVVSFPNEMQQEAIYGASGEVHFDFADAETAEGISLVYYHTWQDGEVEPAADKTMEEALEESVVTQWWTLEDEVPEE